jgi:hypothetical protein
VVAGGNTNLCAGAKIAVPTRREINLLGCENLAFRFLSPLILFMLETHQYAMATTTHANALDPCMRENLCICTAILASARRTVLRSRLGPYPRDQYIHACNNEKLGKVLKLQE